MHINIYIFDIKYFVEAGPRFSTGLALFAVLHWYVIFYHGRHPTMYVQRTCRRRSLTNSRMLVEERPKDMKQGSCTVRYLAIAFGVDGGRCSRGPGWERSTDLTQEALYV